MATSPVLFAALGFSGGELLMVLAIILLLFGGAKLPSLARGLGQSIKEFKKASRDEEEPAKPADAEARKTPAEVTKTPGSN